MRKPLIASLALVFLCAGPLAADAAPNSTSLQGTIVQSSTRWGYEGRAIVTETTLEKSDGSQVSLYQLGGTVDGIGMRVSHSPVLLAKGDTVTVDAKSAQTKSGKTVFTLSTIHSLSSAPSTGKQSQTSNFVQASNSNNTPIYWAAGCTFVNFATEGSTQIAGDLEQEVFADVLATWQGDTRSCSEFELINDGPVDGEVGLDGINLVKFREQSWCKPATDTDPEVCHDSVAAGITTIFFIDSADSDRDGEILDADIELNGVNFAFAVNGQSTGVQCITDYANTLTHEIGHFLGLNHTCRFEGEPSESPAGAPIPLCSAIAATSEEALATMFAFQNCQETLKVTLEADDIAGFCAIYPAANHSTTCKRASLKKSGCCSVAGGEKSPPPIGALLLLALPLLAILRKRAPTTNT